MVKEKVDPQAEPNPIRKGNKPRKNTKWLKISIGANIAIVVLAVLVTAGSYVEHLSNTDSQLCGLCHVMQRNVTSYQTGPNLDHVHEQAGVQCKDCHDYPIPAEVKAGFDYLTGNYTVDKTGNLSQMKFSDAMCTQCHISEQHVATLTDFLARNPHDSHNGELPCNTCHVSHGAQIDYCAQCHDNGGQRMIGQPIKLRGTISGS
jgi:hypothetical protein